MKKVILLAAAALCAAVSCNRFQFPDNWKEKNIEVLQNLAFAETVGTIDTAQIWVADASYAIAGMTVTPVQEPEENAKAVRTARPEHVHAAEYFRVLWGPKAKKTLVVRIEAQGEGVTEYGLYYYDVNDNRIEKPISRTGSNNITFEGDANTDCFGVYIVKNGEKIYSESRWDKGLNSGCTYVAQAEEKSITSNRAYIYLKDVDFKINSNDDIVGLDYDRGPWMVVCEDCGVTSDNDFNDVVFIVHRTDPTHIKVEYCATGATLEDKVLFNTNCLGEIHALLNTDDMINVQADSEPHTYSEIIEVDKDFTMTAGNFGGFAIECNGIRNSLSEIAVRGYAPYMIAVPSYMKWCIERVPIFEAYPEFLGWAHDHTVNTDWFMHPESGKVVEKAAE